MHPKFRGFFIINPAATQCISLSKTYGFLIFSNLNKLTVIVLLFFNTVEDLYNAILCNTMIHVAQKFLSINNAFYNYRNVDTFFLKKKKKVQSLK